MSKRNRAKYTGRRNSPPFVRLDHPMGKSMQWGNLTPYAVKLYIEIALHYNGSNNGDMSASFAQLKHRGWHSKSTLAMALNELQEKGFIIKTRQGGKNKCCLYALTSYAIDNCGGKLDIAANVVPLNAWRQQDEN